MRISLFNATPWQAGFQLRALRNAQQAAIQLEQRRRQREAVEREVAHLLARRSAAASSRQPR